MSLTECDNAEFLAIKNNPKLQDNDDLSSEHNLVSSTNMGDDNNIVIIEESFDPHSTTGILNVCQKKLLKPYMRFLRVMGLRPIFEESREPCLMLEIFNFGYTLQVISFLIIGYILQYISCFRRDRGFGRLPKHSTPNSTELTAKYNETCSGFFATIFIIPSMLHCAGYLYALTIFRIKDSDQLPVLIERVFLTSSHVPNMEANQKQMVRILWFFVIGSFLWMLSSMALVNYMMAEGEITFKWILNSSYEIQICLKILLVICIIWHDIVQASVISNYCLQAQLLKSYVQFLKEKLLQQPVRPLDWIRDLEEFKKLVIYLNNEIAPPVCIFTLINWTYAISGTIWLLESNQDDEQLLSTAVNVVNLILWWFIAAIPFVQAAILTTACDKIRTVGQEVRTRPFAHQDTPLHELNSILIFTTSLKINARLYNLPVNGKYIGIIFAILAVCLLVLSQNHYPHPTH